jgi:pimeloyl-ACP methyl ester carboxylesterase
MTFEALIAAAAASAALSLYTPTGDLQGTELMPEAKPPVPVVLLISGSGPTDRDGNSKLLGGANNSLKMLAEALAENGIASVRYDKRGVAASAAAGTSEADLRFEQYVDDAAAWIAKLKGDRRFSRITVVGHSEGSLIGMLAAKKAGADAFVSIAGIARPADAVLRDQLKGKLPPALAEENERVLSSLAAGKTVPDADPKLASLYRPSVQPYLISWMRYKPAEVVKSIGMPVLILQGTNDIQVGVDEARALNAAASGSRLVLVEGMNHVLKVTPSDPAAQRASYSDPTLPVARPLVDAVVDFVRKGN